MISSSSLLMYGFILFVLLLVCIVGFVASSVFSGPCEAVIETDDKNQTIQKKMFWMSGTTNMDRVFAMGFGGTAFGMVWFGILSFVISFYSSSSANLTRTVMYFLASFLIALTAAIPIFTYAASSETIKKLDATMQKTSSKGGKVCDDLSNLGKLQKQKFMATAAKYGSICFCVGLFVAVVLYSTLISIMDVMGKIYLPLYLLFIAIISLVLMGFLARFMYTNNACVKKMAESGGYKTKNTDPCALNEELSKSSSNLICKRKKELAKQSCLVSQISVITVIILAFFTVLGIVLFGLSCSPYLEELWQM